MGKITDQAEMPSTWNTVTTKRRMNVGQQPELGIGIIGAGFIAETRARCYRRVAGVYCRLAAVADTVAERAETYARRHGVEKWTTDYREVLEDPSILLVDLCVPNFLHRPMAESAAAAGKHIVCTKPLTAYVGQDLPEGAEELTVGIQDRVKMLEIAVADAEAMAAAAGRANVKLMYAENWVHAPAVRKVEELLARANGTVVEMRGGEAHSGSHSPFSKQWRHAGGGALIRLGAHPIGAMLYLKRQEGLRRTGRPVRPVSVVSEVGDLSAIGSVQGEAKAWIARGWVDVENWGTAVITFDDGSRGIAWGSDAVLGGMESRLDILSSNAHFKCNLSPNNLLQAYSPAPEVFGEAYLQEKLETPAGWTTPMPDEDWTSGHAGMIQTFVDAVVRERPFLSDVQLGRDVVAVVYSAYLSASEGRRVSVP